LQSLFYVSTKWNACHLPHLLVKTNSYLPKF
jgi:hypothetical protein